MTASPARLTRPVGRATPSTPATLWVLALIGITPSVVPIGLLVVAGFENGPTTAGIPMIRLVQLLWSTALLTAATTATAGVLGVLTAWLTTRTDLAGRRVWSTLVTLPLVIPSYVGALTLLGASGGAGALSRITVALGWGALPPFRGFWAAWGALSLWNYPFVHLLVAPALRSMPAGLEEVARSLGADRKRILRTVVIPQLRPAVGAASLLVALYTLSDFGAVSLLGYETFTRAIYAQFRGRIDISPALFLSAFLVVVALVLIVAERKTRGKIVHRSGRTVRSPDLVRLSAGRRVLAAGFLSTLVSGALLLPAGVLGYWVWRGLGRGVAIGSLVAETTRAALAGGLAAVATVAAAVPIALLTVRHRDRRTGWLENVAWSTYSLPHLTVGLAFLVVGIRLLPFAYQRLPLLVAAYVALFLPQALAAAQSSLHQISRHFEEASRGLGVGGVGTFRRVILPLMSPGLAAGGAIVFLSVMKELPATLLLRPTGFETLAVRIWSAASEGLYTRASVTALVLLTVSAIPLYVLVSRNTD